MIPDLAADTVLPSLIEGIRDSAAAAAGSPRPAFPPAPAVTPRNGGSIGDPSSLEAVLDRRTSTRFFTDRALDRADVLAVLGHAARADRQTNGADPALALDVLVLAPRTTGLHDRRLHRFDPNRHRLDPVADLPADLDLAETALQPELSAAPAIMMLVGSLAAATEGHGLHGYRLLLRHAGSYGSALWLAAETAGLVGTVFAGLLPHVLRRHADVDGYHRTSMLGFAMGHPL